MGVRMMEQAGLFISSSGVRLAAKRVHTGGGFLHNMALE